MSQLTITLDDDLLQAAQEYAQRHGQELDKLVAELLQAAVRPLVAPEPALVRPSLATVQNLYGSLKAPADFDYKKELEDGRAEQYGL
ncbi:DUF6364 family protein [Hymenobacter psoromatis]|uniref:DUF6364 family protein n=1 Tax=Hymenobacter psoromatis TaxID=1484116 RepID=UPI001CBC5C01|nr:DUF6364 family protein [Hymenobacter psoromatis]